MSETSLNNNNLLNISDLDKSYITILRRLNNEIEFLDKNRICNKQNINITYNNENKKISISFYDNKHRLIEFTVDKRYPTTPPEFFIRTKPYIYYLLPKSREFEKYLYENEDIKCCFHQMSITCHNNWNVTNRLNDLIDEFTEYHQICKRISKKIIANVINRKYLIDDVNISLWL